MAAVVVKALKRGERIGERYEIEKKLGTGGCGSVYRCADTRSGETVAVKVLDNPADSRRFLRESRVMSKASSSRHVVNLLRTGRHERMLPFIVMEFVDGGSLREYLDRQGSLGAQEAAWIAVQALRGLRSCHSVHRDLKPENLLLTSAGRGVRFEPGNAKTASVVKVADFGLAKPGGADLREVTLTRSGQVMGTPAYMSPEQCRDTKQVTLRSDIYALGVILFEMTTGRPPFTGEVMYDIMEAHLREAPQLGKVPRELRDIVGRCLQKDPKARYGSHREMERALAPIAGITGEAVDSDSPSSAMGWLAPFVAVLGLTALGLALWWGWPLIKPWLR
jgi:serine/threonine-protein kinase